MPIFGIIIKNSQDNRIFGSNTHYIMVKIVGIRLPTPVTMIVVLLSPSTSNEHHAEHSLDHRFGLECSSNS